MDHLSQSALEDFAKTMAKRMSEPAEKHVAERVTKHVETHVPESSKTPKIICLYGDLGAGKTTFSRAFIQSITPPETIVTSPTFTIIQNYETLYGPLYHLDLYRIEDIDELYELNIFELFKNEIVLIEWPERLGPHMPKIRTDIHFHINVDDTRHLKVTEHDGKPA